MSRCETTQKDDKQSRPGVRVCCRVRPNQYEFDPTKEDFLIEDVDNENKTITLKKDRYDR